MKSQYIFSKKRQQKMLFAYHFWKNMHFQPCHPKLIIDLVNTVNFSPINESQDLVFMICQTIRIRQMHMYSAKF